MCLSDLTQLGVASVSNLGQEGNIGPTTCDIYNASEKCGNIYNHCEYECESDRELPFLLSFSLSSK